MKYCPLCAAEYKEGRDRCSSCRAALVASLPAEEVRKNPPKLLWIGGSSAEFGAVAGALREAGIPALIEEGCTRILQRLLNCESQICVLQNEFPCALQTAAAAIAALTASRSVEKCYQCESECSAALAVCPKCSAILILERPSKHQPAAADEDLAQTVKYCPLCGAEYASNYRHCTVCGVELVPEEMRGRPFSDQELEEKIVIVWRGGDPAAVSNVVSLLRAAGIRHHVESTHDHFVFELALPRPRYVVRILKRDEERAKELLGDITDSPFFGAEISPDFPEDLSTPARSSDRRWNPAAATVEVWSGDDAAMAKLVGDCLRENHIGFRREGCEPGKLRLLVTNAEEVRAREILREIREGRPLA
ncbi:MAG: hypothetical protein DMG39_01795 [Acidobacteria bacterium]|nr:MAG: hypothetical protein DMG39_01795 [Acidobacteriota bacterium]